MNYAVCQCLYSYRLQVIPRQTCGLFTHTFKKAEYPGGFERLIENTDGGDMFESILHNTVRGAPL